MKFPVDQQFLKYSDQPIWHQQPFYVQSHLNPLSFPFWCSVWTSTSRLHHICNMLWPDPRLSGDEIHSRLLSLNGWMSKWCLQNNTDFIDNWTSFWGRPDLLKRDGLHPSWGGAALISRNMANSLRVRTWLTGAQIRKQTDWLNWPSASRLTSQKSVNSQHI